ncbi:uncharacterized protein PRD47_005644 [Ara ararauna]
MEFIQTFVKSSVKGEAQRMQFLQTICTPCKAARDGGCCQGLKELYHQFQVAEKIQALAEEEATDQPHVVVRQQAMLAIAWMSKVEMALECHKKSLLEVCSRSISFLLPRADMGGLDATLYFRCCSGHVGYAAVPAPHFGEGLEGAGQQAAGPAAVQDIQRQHRGGLH